MANKLLARVKHSFVAIQNILVAQIVSFSFFKKDSLDLIRLGTSYGGWFLPENILRAADKKEFWFLEA